MPANIDQFFFQEFRAGTVLVAQRKAGILYPYVKHSGPHRGEAAVLCQRVGKIKMIKPEVRGGPMGSVNPTTEKPWLYPEFFECPLILDHIDELQVINDPKSGYQEAMGLAMGREWDDQIMTALFGNRVTGKKQETVTPFDTTNRKIAAAVGGAADTGMNGQKVIAAIQKFKSLHVHTEGRKFAMALTSQQWAELIQEPYLSSSLFAPGSRLERGVIGEWMGVTFLHFEDCPKSGNNRQNPIWDCERVEHGMWEDGRTDSGPRRDLSGMPEQLYLSGFGGASRHDEDGVLMVENKE